MHYGKVKDPLPGEDFRFGITDKGSAHVPDCIKNPQSQGFPGKLGEFREEIYLSRKK